RREHVALALAARELPGPGLARLGDPVLDAFGGVFVDHRADEGLLVARVAHAQLADRGLELAPQCVVDVDVDVDALHADATLAALVIGARDQPLDHLVEFDARVGIDNTGRVATKLQHHLLSPGAGLEVPADQTAGETQQRDTLVL